MKFVNNTPSGGTFSEDVELVGTDTATRVFEISFGEGTFSVDIDVSRAIRIRIFRVTRVAGSVREICPMVYFLWCAEETGTWTRIF